MNLQEALEWVEDKCKYNNVRERMKIPFKVKLYTRILLFKIKSIFKKPLKNECPRCGNTHLLSFSSLRYKKCLDCNYIMMWLLKENEKPLVKHQR